MSRKERRERAAKQRDEWKREWREILRYGSREADYDLSKNFEKAAARAKKMVRDSPQQSNEILRAYGEFSSEMRDALLKSEVEEAVAA